MLDARSAKRLRKAVAHYLYIQSKDEPDEKAGLMRAAALALINKQIDADLLIQARRRRSNDDPLYSNEIDVTPRLEDLWEQADKATAAG